MRAFLSNQSIRRILSLILILAVAVPIVLFVTYRRSTNTTQKSVEIIKNEADMVFKNVEQTAIRNGISEWRLNAESAYLIESEKKLFLENPKVEFFLENGNNVLLTAHQGILKIDSKDIEVSGNVVVTQDHYTLKTDKLFYEHDKKRLYTKNVVRITGTRFDLTAGAMNVELDSNKGLFGNGVTGVFNEAYTF